MDPSYLIGTPKGNFGDSMTLRSRLRLPSSFDRDLTMLTFSMSSRRVVMGFLGIIRSIYFALLGFSPVEIGLLLSLATLVSALHSITFGMLSDRFGRKPFFVLGGIFATLRMVILAITTDFWLLALGQGLGALGEGAGAGQPVVSGYISDKTEVRQRASVFSTLAVTNAISATIGSLMAGLPAYFQESLKADILRAHYLLFWIGVFFSALSLLLILPIEDVSPEKAEIDSHEEGFLNVKSWGIIARFSLVRASSGLAMGFVESLMPLYFYIRFGVGGETLGPIYAGIRLISVFSYMFIPLVVDRLGDIPSLVASRIIAGVITIAFSQATRFPLAVFLLVAQRTVLMFTMPIRQSFATGIVDPDETATAIGVSSFARMSLRSVAPTIAGYMFEAISLSMPFMVGAALFIANGLLYKAFFSPKNQQLT
jgi:MFS family permease